MRFSLSLSTQLFTRHMNKFENKEINIKLSLFLFFVKKTPSTLAQICEYDRLALIFDLTNPNPSFKHNNTQIKNVNKLFRVLL